MQLWDACCWSDGLPAGIVPKMGMSIRRAFRPGRTILPLICGARPNVGVPATSQASISNMYRGTAASSATAIKTRNSVVCCTIGFAMLVAVESDSPYSAGCSKSCLVSQLGARWFPRFLPRVEAAEEEEEEA